MEMVDNWVPQMEESIECEGKQALDVVALGMVAFDRQTWRRRTVVCLDHRQLCSLGPHPCPSTPLVLDCGGPHLRHW